MRVCVVNTYYSLCGDLYAFTHSRFRGTQCQNQTQSMCFLGRRPIFEARVKGLESARYG